MATSISLFNAHMVDHVQPSLLLAKLDHDLVPYTKQRNQNCALCYIDYDGATLRTANAGGVPPYVRRVTGVVNGRKCGALRWDKAWELK